MSGGVLHTRGAHTVRTWRIRGATNGSGMDRARERGGSRPAAAVKAALRRRARALGNVDVGLTDGCSQGSKTRVGASGMGRRRRGGAGGGSGGAVAVEAAHKSRRGREGRGAGGRGEGALVVRDKGGSIAFSPNLIRHSEPSTLLIVFFHVLCRDAVHSKWRPTTRSSPISRIADTDSVVAFAICNLAFAKSCKSGDVRKKKLYNKTPSKKERILQQNSLAEREIFSNTKQL